MAEYNQYDDLSEEQLEQLLAEEESSLQQMEEGVGGAVGAGAPNPLTLQSGHSELQEWQGEVADFGGRIASPSSRTLLEELGDSQLGQTAVLPTSAVFPLPIFPARILLAEVNLTKPIAMDVSFNYENMSPVRGSNQTSLDQGDGYVELTWGTPGTFTRSAIIDGNQGWRHPFVASRMRVEYVPIDVSGVFPIAGGQGRDLVVGAQIAPASGAPGSPLIKTMSMLDIIAGASTDIIVPSWSTRLSVQMGTVIMGAAPLWSLAFRDRNAATIGTIGSNATPGEWPAWQGISHWYSIPQRTQTVRVTSIAPTLMVAPSVMFELAL